MLSPNFNFLGFTVASYEQINPHLQNSRTKQKNLVLTRGGVEDTRLKAKDTKKFQGQGQTLSRPRTQTQEFSKKKVFKNFFQAISKKKVFKNCFSGDLYVRKPKKKVFADFSQGFWQFPTKFHWFKNSAVLEPRT